MRIEKDFKDFLKSLNENDVKYLVVGGFAYSFYAEPRYTKDIDIFVDISKENLDRVLKAVQSFWGEDCGLKLKDLQKEDVFIQLGYPPVRIDLVTSIRSVNFSEAWENRVIGKYGDIKIFFISLDDLINNKEATGRDRDLLDAKYLRRVKNRL